MTPAPTPNRDRGFALRLVALAAFVALLFGGYYLRLGAAPGIVGGLLRP